ncbi:hypothetical protein GY45DRAFT_1341020 [Cubamyces sp. BRFM 1775]|nr:hypothetical protein GY45DRAFT_1341020 [Cubamyces sp. BRFM 1775]
MTSMSQITFANPPKVDTLVHGYEVAPHSRKGQRTSNFQEQRDLNLTDWDEIVNGEDRIGTVVCDKEIDGDVLPRDKEHGFIMLVVWNDIDWLKESHQARDVVYLIVFGTTKESQEGRRVYRDKVKRYRLTPTAPVYQAKDTLGELHTLSYNKSSTIPALQQQWHKVWGKICWAQLC